MRILIDTHLSDEKTDGIGRYLNELVRALLRIDQQNEYVLLTNSGIGVTHQLQSLEAPNLVKIPVGLRGLDWRAHFVIPRIMNRVRPDVYHHPHFDLPWFHNIPSLITVHGLKYIKHPEFYKCQSGSTRVYLKRVYMETMMGLSIRKAQRVIAVSRSVKDDIMSVFKTTHDKVSVVHLGSPLKHNISCTDADISKFYKKYGIKGKVILFVGAQLPHKNLIRLIEAFDIFQKSIGGMFQLVIAGRSYSSYSKPLDKVQELALEEKVIFTEHLRDDELKIIYRTAEVFVMPSLYEGFGLPVLEAMNNGVPVIASNLSSLPEIVGEAGILVNPFHTQEIAAALEKIVTDNTTFRELKVKGVERAGNFTWETAAQQTLETYREVYEKSG
ncbi:MAG: glycosyltransferase family 4 protein [Gemmatimonadota bacterium]|nr:MAG: glycosyltransferase family 4 protein [Gemmatimonadota bacterium]